MYINFCFVRNVKFVSFIWDGWEGVSVSKAARRIPEIHPIWVLPSKFRRLTSQSMTGDEKTPGTTETHF